MPLVEMRYRIGGFRDGKPWPMPGETIDVPDDEAAQLIEMGAAVAPDDAAVEESEESEPVVEVEPPDEDEDVEAEDAADETETEELDADEDEE